MSEWTALQRGEDRCRRLESDLAPWRDALVNHAVYRRVGDPGSLRLFMSHHVFAVWDFMALLKTLQRRLTCVEVPWLPPDDPTAARLVNEIVLGEESDEVEPGRYSSHYDLYLEGMEEIGADTRPIRTLVERLREGAAPDAALLEPTIPEAARKFVKGTLRTCEASTLDAAASFLLGREDLVPAMFRPIIAEIERAGTPCRSFRLYLERHVLLDEERHGPMARRLLAGLCGTNEERWTRAASAARDAMTSRRAMWDGVLRTIG